MIERIVHLMPDDKFTDNFIRMASKYANTSSSYIVFTRSERKYSFIEKRCVIYLDLDSKFIIDQLVSLELNKSAVIVLHSFDIVYSAFLCGLPKSVKIIWIIWGIELYSAFPKSKYLSSRSLSLQFKKNFRGRIKFLVFLFVNKLISSKGRKYREIIKRADYSATFVLQDHLLAKEINPNIRTLSFNYFIDEYYELNDLNESKFGSGNILLGNSANPTNEHVWVLEHLNNINFSSKIYCPLSYSGISSYTLSIIKLGKDYFGNNFIPLTSFLPYKEYSEIIDDCDYVIFNHVRQQAVGNIMKSIVSLKPIILNSKSYLRSTFDDWGLKIYDIDVLTDSSIVRGEDLLRNREIVLVHTGISQNLEFFNKIEELSINSNSVVIN
jgi:hypothetical protein